VLEGMHALQSQGAEGGAANSSRQPQGELIVLYFLGYIILGAATLGAVIILGDFILGVVS